ncbi:MAG: hypothetical protein WD604_07520 [Balneolaceae bacterium]
MVTVIKKGSSAKSVIEKYQKHIKASQKEPVKKYCGILTLKKDPVKLQKEWRDDWE